MANQGVGPMEPFSWLVRAWVFFGPTHNPHETQKETSRISETVHLNTGTLGQWKRNGACKLYILPGLPEVLPYTSPMHILLYPLSLSLLIDLPICQSQCQSIHLSVYLSIYGYVHPSIHPYPSISINIHPYPSISIPMPQNASISSPP
jgi:hypothetical protein